MHFYNRVYSTLLFRTQAKENAFKYFKFDLHLQSLFQMSKYRVISNGCQTRSECQSEWDANLTLIWDLLRYRCMKYRGIQRYENEFPISIVSSFIDSISKRLTFKLLFVWDNNFSVLLRSESTGKGFQFFNDFLWIVFSVINR